MNPPPVFDQAGDCVVSGYDVERAYVPSVAEIREHAAAIRAGVGWKPAPDPKIPKPTKPPHPFVALLLDVARELGVSA